MTDVLRKGRGRFETQTERTEVEPGVMWPQAKGYLEPQKRGVTKKGSSPQPLEGMWPCQHLDFRLLASRSARE